MSRAEKGQRKTIEACERIAQVDAAVLATLAKVIDQRSALRETLYEASSSTAFFCATSSRRGGGLFKYVVLYALTLVLQPVLAVVLTLAALWGLWKAFLWLIVL